MFRIKAGVRAGEIMANERRKLGRGYGGKPTAQQRMDWFDQDRFDAQHEKAVESFLSANEAPRSPTTATCERFREAVNRWLIKRGGRPIGREVSNRAGCPFTPTA